MIEVVNNVVDARKLHTELESKKDFSNWIKEKIVEADLELGKDFTTLKAKSTGGRPTIDYALTIDSAKEICLLQQTPKGKEIRRKLIEVSKQVENNQILSLPKVALLIKLLNTFKYGEYQLEAEEMHKSKFLLSTKTKENIHKLFHEHRADLLGIDNNQLKADLIQAYKNGLIHTSKASNIRGRIFLLDKYELVRMAVVEYLISTGTSEHNAITFGETVKQVAIETNLDIRIKNEDNLFQFKGEVETPMKLELNGVKLINP